MKKIISLVFVCVLLSFSAFNVSAQDIDKNNVEFTGEIIPLRKFYDGEFPKNSDFKINGSFINTDTKEEISNSEWRIFSFEPVYNNESLLILKHIPSLELDIPIYEDIAVTVKVKSSEFNPILKCQTRGRIYTKVSDLSLIFNKYDFVFRNDIGRIIDGDLIYDNTELKTGVNYINYSFTPTEYLTTDYGYGNYDTVNGQIKIIIVE